MPTIEVPIPISYTYSLSLNPVEKLACPQEVHAIKRGWAQENHGLNDAGF